MVVITASSVSLTLSLQMILWQNMGEKFQRNVRKFQFLFAELPRQGDRAVTLRFSSEAAGTETT